MLDKLFDDIYDWTMFYLDNSILSEEKKQKIRTMMDKVRDGTHGKKA